MWLVGWLVGWLVSWHINLYGLFNAKTIFIEEQLWCNLTHSFRGGDKKVHIFPKGISPKVNIVLQWKVQFAYYNVAETKPTSLL